MSDSKHSSDLKEEGVLKTEKTESTVPLDAHYDPDFVRRTLYVLLLIRMLTL